MLILNKELIKLDDIKLNIYILFTYIHIYYKL